LETLTSLSVAQKTTYEMDAVTNRPRTTQPFIEQEVLVFTYVKECGVKGMMRTAAKSRKRNNLIRQARVWA